MSLVGCLFGVSDFGHLKKRLKALGALVQIWWLSEEMAVGFFLNKFWCRQFSNRLGLKFKRLPNPQFEARDLPFSMVNPIIYIN